MIPLFKQFISDLNLPGYVIESLEISRNNDEMKIFALSVPDLLYPDTYILAGRIYIYLNTMTAPKTVGDYVEILGRELRPEIRKFMTKNEEKLNGLLEETYYYNFKDHNILSASKCVDYLLKVSKYDPPVETPCLMMLRQAVQFYHEESLDDVVKCYRELIEQEYVHASPTMFNAGTRKNQLSSCFLISIGDNLEDLLYTGAGDVGMISKLQGGIGMSLNSVRHSAISNTGKSSGVLPFARIYDSTIRCVDQGGKRNGAATISLNDWHIDVEDFICARDNYSQDGIRLKQANTALFVSSLFMRRVRKDEEWTLFCPAKAELDDVRLTEVRGAEFDNLYHRLEDEIPRRKALFEEIDLKIKDLEREINSMDKTDPELLKQLNIMTRERVAIRKNLIDYKVVKARKMYNLICNMQMKSSFPYIVYSDTMNLKNNTMNIGLTQSSNLCVAPETKILTDRGQLPIGELENQAVNIWNGKEFSEVVVKKTGTNQELIKVWMRDGTFLECTPYHKFYIGSELEKSKEVRACDLKENMRLVDVTYPIVNHETFVTVNNIISDRWELNEKCIMDIKIDSLEMGRDIKLKLQTIGCHSTLSEGKVSLSFEPTYVDKVEWTGRFSDTYCFNEPKRHMGIFNGIAAGNCLEITLPATPTEIASCNLGHVNLKKFVKTGEDGALYYDYNHLGRATQALVRNIDKVVTYNYYPLDERDKSGNVTEIGKIHRPNIENRPLGIGVSGLAEVFALFRIPYESDEAAEINKKIFAAMYFNGLYQSMLLAKKDGVYKTFKTGESRVFTPEGWKTLKGSPLSNGLFQFDLWKMEADYLDSIGELNEKIYRREDDDPILPSEWGNDLPIKTWEELEGQIMKHGVRNSMLMALMPTASSAQMLRNAETTEAHQTLVYSRKLSHGNYIAFSEPFVEDMIEMKIWNKKMVDFINISNGTIDGIHFFITENPEFFPDLHWTTNDNGEKKLSSVTLRKIMKLREIHKGMYEISQKTTARMARQRGIYVCQSQSFNCYLPDPNEDLLKSFHMYTDALRLKTGMYYLRANPASQTGRFTADLDVQKYHSGLSKTRKNFVCAEDECIMCS